MCKRNFVKPSQPDLTDFLCEKAKPIMPYIRELMVLGVAEPFWKDALFKIYDKVEFWRYKHRVKFHTNTNVICLDEKTIRRFFEQTEISDLAFSFDAATPETFKKIRRMNVFDTVVRNARNYIRIRNEYGGSEKHKVHIWNNINLLNIDEMTQMVEMAVDIGVDYMVMLPTYDQQGLVKLGELMLCKKNVKLFAKAAEKAKKRADELGLWLYYAKSFDVAPDENPIYFELPQVEENEIPCGKGSVGPKTSLIQLILPKLTT
jgi:MoaA/NifB/PqqE/SkfB family radical SAM enzyme